MRRYVLGLVAVLLHNNVSLFICYVLFARFERVCLRCRKAAASDYYWRALCIAKFNLSGNEEVPSWRELYRYDVRMVSSRCSGAGNRSRSASLKYKAIFGS